ncbi:MAG TPA: hypothetical protein VKF82_00155 [Candidatus Eremiobacteraceae bacterium]|nr:hypothetical protein [Candidatus Eremiobacteraceae bacterium]
MSTKAVGLFAVATGACAALIICASPARAGGYIAVQSEPGANEIFDRALTFVRSQTYPPYVSSVITVDTQAKGRWLVEQFASVCRSRDDRVDTTAKPLSSTEQPDNPYRVTLKVKGLPVKDSPNIDEPFGLPQISPLYDFGLARLAPATSAARAYDVSLLGVESLHGRHAYLLELTPLLDPKAHRVREMWVDAKTFAVLKLTSAGAFRTGQATTVTWTVSYTINHGRWLIENESTSASLLLGGYAPVVDPYVALPGATRYDGVSYTFTDFQFLKNVSDLLFLESTPSEATQQ